MAIPVVPTWGNVAPQQVIGYRVVVVPKRYTETCWDFLILIPAGGEEPEDLVLVGQMCEAALEAGDTFNVYRISHSDEEELSHMPVMWLGETEDEPQWLTPPVAMMN